MSLMGILDRVADAAALDKVIDPARRAVQAGLPQPVKNLLHGTWLGHPVHPVMVHIPVGAWLSAGVLDLIPPFRPAATALIGTGVASAVPAALSGTADWSEQDAGVRRLGALHAVLNTAALGIYIGSLASRRRGRGSVEDVHGRACLVCPWHGSAFDLDSGTARRGPAGNGQEKLEVRMEAGRVMARLAARNR